MILNVYMRESAVSVLGPGVRYALWVQGCRKRCRYCTAPDSRPEGKGVEMEVNYLVWDIILSGRDGITISGGEPFLQAEQLAEMLKGVKKHKDIGVIVYTGYRYEELNDIPFADELLKLTDLLIDGEYIHELDDGKSLRGSSNQRVIPLTERYAEYLGMYGCEGRPVERFVHGGEIHDVGVADHITGGKKNEW